MVRAQLALYGAMAMRLALPVVCQTRLKAKAVKPRNSIPALLSGLSIAALIFGSAIAATSQSATAWPRVHVGEQLNYQSGNSVFFPDGPHQMTSSEEYTVLAASATKIDLRHHVREQALDYTNDVTFADGIYHAGAGSPLLTVFLAGRLYLGPTPGALSQGSSWSFIETRETMFGQPGARRLKVSKVSGDDIELTIDGNGAGAMSNGSQVLRSDSSGQPLMEKDRFHASARFNQGILEQLTLRFTSEQQQPGGGSHELIMERTTTRVPSVSP